MTRFEKVLAVIPLVPIAVRIWDRIRERRRKRRAKEPICPEDERKLQNDVDELAERARQTEKP